MLGFVRGKLGLGREKWLWGGEDVALEGGGVAFLEEKV